MNTEVNAEIAVAVNFMLSHLYNKLPRRRVDAFAEEVEKGILSKFQGHWYPEKPSKGAAYRCIAVSNEKIDPVILRAARQSGLDVDEVKSCLPDDLMLWIDPGEVSYTVGDRGGVKVLYSEHPASMRPHTPSACSQMPQSLMMDHMVSQLQGCMHAAGLSPESTCSCEASSRLSSSLESLSLSPLPVGGGSGNSGSNSPWPNAAPTTAADPWGHQFGLTWPSPPSTAGPAALRHQQPPLLLPPLTAQPSGSLQPPQPPQLPPGLTYGASARGGGGGGAPTSGANKTFTAAMFAQTKFGSTKLKSKAKNPSRLSPSADTSQAFGGVPPATHVPPAAYLPHTQSLAVSPSMAGAPLLLQQHHHHHQQQQQQQQRRASGQFYDCFQDVPLAVGGGAPTPHHQSLAPPAAAPFSSRDGTFVGAAFDEPLLTLTPAAITAAAAEAGRAQAWLDFRGIAYPAVGPFRHVMVA